MRVGMAADHGGYVMKEKIHILLGANDHQVVDFGNVVYEIDDYPDLPFRLELSSLALQTFPPEATPGCPQSTMKPNNRR